MPSGAPDVVLRDVPNSRVDYVERQRNGALFQALDVILICVEQHVLGVPTCYAVVQPHAPAQTIRGLVSMRGEG